MVCASPLLLLRKESSKVKKIILVSNYRSDRQQSMLRFGEILRHNFHEQNRFAIEEIFPSPVLGKLFRYGSVKKWLAYWDKFILFPRRLKKLLAANCKKIDAVHIIDHSNAPYLKTLRNYSSVKKIITCHDLIAVQTALGEFSTAPKISGTGIMLQKWIQSSLSLADFYACDSEQTKNDLNRVIPHSKLISKVIHLGTEFNDSSPSKASKQKCEIPFEPDEQPFFLHVGSAAWYKNRKSVFRSFINAKKQTKLDDLKLLLVGPKIQNFEIDEEIGTWLQANQEDIVSVPHVSEPLLQNLYLNAKALIFPSHVEGFGWPPLEAASVGCPVITTKTGAIFDLLGNYATYTNSNDQAKLNQDVINFLKNPDKRKEKVKLPNHQDCRNEYLKLYERISGS